jgi:nucleoside-diphosphate-sugar epimerase
MRVLVTGGAGFLGGWVIGRLLARGHEVRVFDASADRRVLQALLADATDELDWAVGDVAESDDVMAAARGCHHVVHLAALLTPACQADPVRGARVNLIGTLNVFEAALRHGMRGVAYASSAGVYGADGDPTPRPTTHYGAFKLATEGCARAYWADHGLRSVGLRPFVVYGPGRGTGLTADTTLACRAAVRGEPYVIGFTGACDFIFADDVAAAFEAAVLETPDGAHAFNPLGQVADVEEVIATIRRLEPGAVLSAEGPSLPTQGPLPADDLGRVLPGLPRTGLEDGLRRTLEHYRP